ncbi:MAG: hypothetical protein ACRC9K_24050 [Afipia sp.]
MTKTREYLAQRARIRRSIAKQLAQQQAAVRRSHISEVLNQIKAIISDKEFITLLVAQKVKTAPECLYRQRYVSTREMTDAEIADAAFAFVVAWRFLFPLLSSPEIALYLERVWPGFVTDFKDTFIALVMDGPFPGERRTPVRPTYFS